MDLILALGELAFASRLRRLSDRLMRDVSQVYAACEADFEPRWFPLLYLLRSRSPLAITEIATTLGVTHPAVNQIAAAMSRKGLVVSIRDRRDDRRRLLALSPAGRALAGRLVPVWSEIEAATRELLDAEGTGILASLDRIERSLDRQSVAARVRARRAPDHAAVQIVPYTERLRGAFARLNREWIEEFFTLEPCDEAVLADPEGAIVQPGGAVFFALGAGEPLGTVALLRRDATTFELAKMAVTAAARGGGIGRRLALVAIDHARTAGATRLILFTSKKLVAATRLYRSLGFRPVRPSRQIAHPYRRPTYAMEMALPGETLVAAAEDPRPTLAPGPALRRGR